MTPRYRFDPGPQASADLDPENLGGTNLLKFYVTSCQA